MRLWKEFIMSLAQLSLYVTQQFHKPLVLVRKTRH